MPFSLKNKVLVIVLLALLIIGVITAVFGIAWMMSGKAVQGGWVTGISVAVVILSLVLLVMLVVNHYRQLSEPARLVSDYMQQLINHQESLREKNTFFPWFYVISPDEDDKNTMMVALRFRMIPPANNQVLNWLEIWSEGRTVFICPTHELLTLDKSDPLLAELLSCIHGYRKNRTFNGTLVNTSPTVLQDPDIFGQELPQHIIRLCELIGQSLPVMFLTTGIDTIFSKTVLNRNFSREERSKSWGGWRHDLQQSASAWFIECWQTQMQQLFCRQIHAMGDDYDEPRCNDSVALVFEFIQLGAVLSKFVTYFEEAFDKQRPQLRGYLLVATGESRQLTSLLSEWCHQYYGLSTTLSRPCLPDIAFASGLVQQVLLPMSQYAGTNRSAQVIHRLGMFVFVITLSVAVGGSAWWCYLNLDALDKLNTETNHVVNVYATERIKSHGHRGDNLNDTIAKLAILRKLNKTYENLPFGFFLVHWAIKSGANVFHNFYDEQLKSQLYPYLVASAERNLTEQLRHPETQSVFDSLRLYQMLFDPASLHKNDFIQALIPVISEDYQLSVASGYRLSEQIKELLSLPEYPVLLPDTSLLNQARDSLSGLSDSQLAYRRLKSDPELMRSVPLPTLLGVNFNKVFQLGSYGEQNHACVTDIPFMFTLECWQKNLLSQDSLLFQKIYADIKSIKGMQSSHSSDFMVKTTSELHQRYALEYISQWQSILNCIHVKPLKDFSVIREASSNLAQWELSSLAGVLEMLDRNTRIVGQIAPTPNTGDNRETMLDTPGVQEITQVFEHYHRLVQGDSVLQFSGRSQGIINELYQKMLQMEQCEDKQKCAYLQLTEIVESQHPLNTLVVFADLQPEQVKRWLLEFSHELVNYYMEYSSLYLQKKWEEKVVLPYNRYLKHHFPLDLSASKESDFKHFSTFFKPGGQFDSYIKTYLTPFIGDHKLKPLVLGKVLPISQAFRESIKAGKQISETFFSPEGTPLDAFQVRIVFLSPTATHFTVQDKDNMIRYDHGPNIWQDITMTQGGKGFVEATFFSQETPLSHASYSGDWGWFRFFRNNFRYADRKTSLGYARLTLGKESIAFEIMEKGNGRQLLFDPTLMNQFKIIEHIF